MGADGDEIRPGPGIIVSLHAYRTAVMDGGVVLGVIGHGTTRPMIVSFSASNRP